MVAVSTAQTLERRRALNIIERRPRDTRVNDRWALTLANRDIDLVVCDGDGTSTYRDLETGHIGRWDDHCLRACELAEDPKLGPWMLAEARRRRRVARAASAVVGPSADRILTRKRFRKYPDRFDLKVALRQADGTLMLAERGWRDQTAGIYMIRGITGCGSLYIGESADIIGRWLQHQYALKRGEHKNPNLQAAWDNHAPGIDGVDGLEWIVLEVLPEEQVSPQERRVIEALWIQSFAQTRGLCNVVLMNGTIEGFDALDAAL